MSRSILPLLAVGAALALSACGLHDPLNDPKPTSTARPAAPATSPVSPSTGGRDDQEAADRRDPSTLRTAAPKATASAADVASAYGLAQTNWSWRTYTRQYQRMTELAAGQLARDLQANPPEPDQLEGIRADRQTNRSTAIAVDATRLSATRQRVIVVYEELPGGGGVTETTPHHTIYQATVTKTADGWRVTAWVLLP
jgi:hypothetical protein